MPRRPTYPDRETPFLTRIADMLKDPRTWGTLLYLVAMLPLGVFYFTFAVVGLVTSIAMETVHKAMDYYAPLHGRTLHRNDPEVAMAWPSTVPPLRAAERIAGRWLAECEKFD
jgi:hypothetical protein